MRWQQGDDMAFEMLYKRYVIELMTLIAGKTGSEETARELTQDVFLAVYLQKMDLHLIGHFNAWLFTIAKNKIFNYYRHELVKRKYHNQLLLNERGTMADEENRLLENKEQLQIIQRQIEKLPPKCREVFKLSRQENLTYKSIAQRLNISEHTVDQHIRKALGILRSTLERQHRYLHNELIALPRERSQAIEKLQQSRQKAG
jgi:RNA polymerase sigma-70 factor (ECF subfamily)